MDAGKSTYALQLAHSLDKAGYSPTLIKPKLDSRDPGVIRSRLGIERECFQIDADDVASIVKGSSHVICDEAQFFTRDEVHHIVDYLDGWNIPSYFFGLRTSYTGDLFEGSAALMAIADELIELPLISTDGNKRVMHIRTIDGQMVFDGDPIFVGDVKEDYVSVSRRQWFRARDAVRRSQESR